MKFIFSTFLLITATFFTGCKGQNHSNNSVSNNFPPSGLVDLSGTWEVIDAACKTYKDAKTQNENDLKNRPFEINKIETYLSDIYGEGYEMTEPKAFARYLQANSENNELIELIENENTDISSIYLVIDSKNLEYFASISRDSSNLQIIEELSISKKFQSPNFLNRFNESYTVSLSPTKHLNLIHSNPVVEMKMFNKGNLCSGYPNSELIVTFERKI